MLCFPLFFFRSATDNKAQCRDNPEATKLSMGFFPEEAAAMQITFSQTKTKSKSKTKTRKGQARPQS